MRPLHRRGGDDGGDMGNVAIVGAGPGGLAATLALTQAGHTVTVYEKNPEVRSSGNILNLWPPPLKVLKTLGVDIDDFGYPCTTYFRRADGRQRVEILMPEDVKRDWQGGFIGLLRPELYERLQAALPPGVLRTGYDLSSVDDHGDGVTLRFANGETAQADLVVGADGIHSAVRKALWGDQPIRMHGLHCFGGFTFADIPDAAHGECNLLFSKDKQGSYSSIKNKGRIGYQWWITSLWEPGRPFTGDMKSVPLEQAKEFAHPLRAIVEATDPGDIVRWEIRDRPPLERWSKGRGTIIGDAAHPTSPYAAYGAGMAIEDGYFLGRQLAGLDLGDRAALEAALLEFEEPRRKHTRQQAGIAYQSGKLYHHTPRALRGVRDLVLDHTPLLQKIIGDSNPKTIYQLLDAVDGPIRATR
jgi:2-polyprenyl-6-methoxyphenol hydroxylase-like FAD-dependent oxidoreductase